MKIKEIIIQLKNKSEAELTKELTDYQDKLWALKTDLRAGKVKNVREIRTVKRIIAVLKTFLNRK